MNLHTTDPAELATVHLETARNIKRWITVNPANDSTQARLMIADHVHMARLHNHKAIASKQVDYCGCCGAMLPTVKAAIAHERTCCASRKDDIR